jgi:acyl-[acyl-carrier-protein]-phospholipid O-acyltransferase/long-chain-fatty-acid--[acyl-carrier-protein] ligase
MSAQSALFGPAKYGIIPELVRRDQLSRANSQLVLMTYLAIILGTAFGPWLAEQTGGRYAWAAAVCVVIAVLGTLTSLGIERTPAAGSTARASLFFLKDVRTALRSIRGDRQLVLAVWAAAYFSLVGSFLQLNLILYGMKHLGISETDSGYLFFFAGIGIGLGSWLAGRLSGRNVEFGVVPIGALLLAASSLGLGLSHHSLNVTRVLVLAAGMGAGLFLIPLEAFIQLRSPAERRGEVLAAKGFISWVAIAGGAALVYLFGATGLSPAGGFIAMGLLTVALGLISVKVLPDFLIRFITMLLTRVCYRLRALGLENLPVDGGGLLVANHVSFMDALQILAVQQRRIRFMMHRRIYETNPLRPLFRLMGVIPIAMEDPPKKIVESLRAARQAMDDGFLVCIFAEGALTRTGIMRGFKPGFERIVRDSTTPSSPSTSAAPGAASSATTSARNTCACPASSHTRSRSSFGPPLPATARAPEVRQAVMELSCRYFEERRPLHTSLGASFIRLARQRWSRPAMDDTTGRELTWGHSLAGAVALSRLLRRRTEGQPAVGILLPPSVGGALVNLALTLLRKTTVNLNFTVSPEAFRSALEQARLQTIVTSRAFVEKFPQFADLPGLLYVEDLRDAITPAARVRRCWRPGWRPWDGSPAGAGPRPTTWPRSSSPPAPPAPPRA